MHREGVPRHDLNFTPVRANLGFSLAKGTLRGLHYQDATAPKPSWCVPRTGRCSMWCSICGPNPQVSASGGVELTAENGRMLFVPERHAHGYQTLEKATELHYIASAFYTPEAAHGVRFDDPVFGVQWPLPPTSMSDQDCNWPAFIQT